MSKKNNEQTYVQVFGHENGKYKKRVYISNKNIEGEKLIKNAFNGFDDFREIDIEDEE